jgi:hypothetical protein
MSIACGKLKESRGTCEVIAHRITVEERRLWKGTTAQCKRHFRSASRLRPQRRACKNRWVVALSEAVEELRSDRIHGGSWMARRAVEALLEVNAEPATSTANLLERLLDAGRKLATARPAMGGITHAVGRLVASAQTGVAPGAR